MESNTPRRGSLTQGVRRLSSFSVSHNRQKLTDQQKKVLSNFSSVSYAPADNQLYQNWLKEHPPSLGWERWLMICIIGISVGLTAVLMRQCLDALDKIKWDRTKHYVSIGDYGAAWAWTTGISVLYVIFGSSLVAFIHPPAGGNGVPEVISYLNGVVVHGTMGLKNFVIKFTANVLAVSSGLPCAIQGPIIALGAIVGNGMGQFHSKTLKLDPHVFERFRNTLDRRHFTTAGVAAGVAAAFNAPIGGLMFAIEDISSFWSRKTAWHTFLCCGIATATAKLFNAGFKGFIFQGIFGTFGKLAAEPLKMNIVILVPAIVLGVIGGLLGAGFTRGNVFIQAQRRKLHAKVKGDYPKKTVRVVEVIFLTIIMAMVTICLPFGFGCGEDPRNASDFHSQCGFTGSDFGLQKYRCTNQTGYNEAGTLLIGSGGSLLNKLQSRNTHYLFGYGALFAVFPIYFFMTCWTAGSGIAGGIFVPVLVNGSMYGRIIGLICLDIYRASTGNAVPDNDSYWHWIDPGAIAIIGAASLLGGVTRLTLAVTVIIVEMTQDIDIILPVLAAIFVAKLVADLLSRPLYKYLLDIKALPFLDAEPIIVVNNEEVNLDSYRACDVMRKPVISIHSVESVAALAKLLKETNHTAFPVLKYDDETKTELLQGLITRTELLVILRNDKISHMTDTKGEPITPNITYEQLSVDYLDDASVIMERVNEFTKFDQYNRIYINLAPFINMSAAKIDQNYSLHRTYMMFRTLGLRHLLVTDMRNRCVGIITRKDLIAFNISEKLQSKEEEVEYYPERRASDIVLPATTLYALEEEEHHTDHDKVDVKVDENFNDPMMINANYRVSDGGRSGTNL